MEYDWQSKLTSIRERTAMLFKTNELCDCEFLVGSKKVKVSSHKLFLAISSPVFYAMFFGDMGEKGSVEVPDIEPDAFKGMLEFIYTDHVTFESCTHVWEVYSAAIKYIIPSLQKYCIRYLHENVNANSACEVFSMFDYEEIKDLKNDCIMLFQHDTQNVLKSNSFLEADFSTVLTIFKQDVLKIDSELELFNGLKAWTDAEAARTGVPVESLSSTVTEAINQIKFLEMTAEEFTSGPALSPLLTSEEKLAISMNITKPGITKLPERIEKIGEPRSANEPIRKHSEQVKWSLERVVSDSIVYPITRWVNPFPRKGLTPSRSIKLKGVTIASQRFGSRDDSSLLYKENVTVVVKKDWAVTFSGSNYIKDTPYNSIFTVQLCKPVLLEAGKKHWIIVQFDKPGSYRFTRDAFGPYKLNDIEIQLHEEFSPITEFHFVE